MDRVKKEIESSIEVKQKIISDEDLMNKIHEASLCVKHCIKGGNKVFFAGNGGSAADSQHIAAEFVSKYKNDSVPLAAIALTTDTSILTAIGNDYGFNELFARQLQALASKGDVFIGITTSGRSKNILEGFKSAQKVGIKTIALCGGEGIDENYIDYVDICLKIPSRTTARIQESHILVGHIICDYVEEDYILR